MIEVKSHYWIIYSYANFFLIKKNHLDWKGIVECVKWTSMKPTGKVIIKKEPLSFFPFFFFFFFFFLFFFKINFLKFEKKKIYPI